MLGGGLNPAYVLDKMKSYEIEIALTGLHIKHKESWEQTRQLMWAVFQTNCKDKIDSKIVLHFPWDEGDTPKGEPEEETPEYRERIEAMMNQIIKEKENASGFSNKTLA